MVRYLRLSSRYITFNNDLANTICAFLLRDLGEAQQIYGIPLCWRFRWLDEKEIFPLVSAPHSKKMALLWTFVPIRAVVFLLSFAHRFGKGGPFLKICVPLSVFFYVSVGR